MANQKLEKCAHCQKDFEAGITVTVKDGKKYHPYCYFLEFEQTENMSNQKLPSWEEFDKQFPFDFTLPDYMILRVEAKVFIIQAVAQAKAQGAREAIDEILAKGSGGGNWRRVAELVRDKLSKYK